LNGTPSITRYGATDFTVDHLISPVDKNRFQHAICSLHSRFSTYVRTSPTPFPAAGLIITPEIRAQSELYLPVAEISAIFTRLYCAALSYPPILSSTSFHSAISWADCFVGLQPQFQRSANPARLLESLLDDPNLLSRFLFASFLPDRFYGGKVRYPEQQKFITTWLETRTAPTIRCLDAACGSGEDTYALARHLLEWGFSVNTLQIEGWTLDPLEVWAATHRRFPHDPQREALFRERTAWLSDREAQGIIHFRCRDLLEAPSEKPFDLILCNGLLGGPIINRREDIERVVAQLAGLLAPGGVLLAADRFHGGWKQKCPQSELQALFEHQGLEGVSLGDGIGGKKS
jgi:chemotaxis methyl-accepting protein methylase